MKKILALIATLVGINAAGMPLALHEESVSVEMAQAITSSRLDKETAKNILSSIEQNTAYLNSFHKGIEHVWKMLDNHPLNDYFKKMLCKTVVACIERDIDTTKSSKKEIIKLLLAFEKQLENQTVELIRKREDNKITENEMFGKMDDLTR